MSDLKLKLWATVCPVQLKSILCELYPGSYKDATCLVTIGEKKYYSTGVDVQVVRSPDRTAFIQTLTEFQKLLVRLLTFPVVTVAAINGQYITLGYVCKFFQYCMDVHVVEVSA